MKVLLLLTLLLFSFQSFACECLARKWSIKRFQEDIASSDLAFIGNRIYDNEEGYSFKVVEVFKGSVEKDTLMGRVHGGCSGNPNYEGLWIVYATLEEDGLIDFSACGLSRSLSVPSFSYVPKGLVDSAQEQYYKEKQTEILPIFLRDWQNEYTILQSLKDKPAQTKVITDSKEGNTISYMALAVALGALAIVLLKK